MTSIDKQEKLLKRIKNSTFILDDGNETALDTSSLPLSVAQDNDVEAILDRISQDCGYAILSHDLFA